MRDELEGIPTAEQADSFDDISRIFLTAKQKASVVLSEDIDDKTYAKAAKARCLEIRKAYDAFVVGQQASESIEVMRSLYEYFLACEKHSHPVFDLKGMHNAVCRDFDNPGFHHDLMSYCIAESDDEDPDTVNLAIKAEEFTANRFRREGINMKSTAADMPTFDSGTNRLIEAERIFRDVEAHWEDIGDTTSLKRVWYEFAELAGQDIPPNWELAAEFHKKARNMAAQEMSEEPLDELPADQERQDSFFAFCTAQIKYCEACLKHDGTPLSDMSLNELVRHFEHRKDSLIDLAGAKYNHQGATEWIGNAWAHLAEAQEAAGDKVAALASWRACLADPVVQTDAFRQLRETAEKAVARLDSGE